MADVSPTSPAGPSAASPVVSPSPSSIPSLADTASGSYIVDSETPDTPPVTPSDYMFSNTGSDTYASDSESETDGNSPHMQPEVSHLLHGRLTDTVSEHMWVGGWVGEERDGGGWWWCGFVGGV